MFPHRSGFFAILDRLAGMAFSIHRGVLIVGLAIQAPSAVAGEIQNTPAATTSQEQAIDPLFAHPYIDIDEWRDAPVRHHYVHGGFTGTDTRFSFYFPPKAKYRGHFFQHLTPVPDSENLAQQMPAGEYNKIGFAITSGAYFVETNGGGHLELGKAATSTADPTIASYRANAAAAQYSRVVAMKLYGGKRPYGYAYGGSGGAYRTISAMENTHGVWDGAVPYVPGSTMAIPNVFTVRIRAMRILNDVFPQILDAVSPGGSGDPYAGLTPEQADTLREATRMGFPPQSWFDYKTMGIHGLAALYPAITMVDRSYFTDFWTKPGYLGFDHPEQFAKARVQYSTTIGQLVTAADAAKQGLNTDASSNANRGGVDNAFRAPTGADGQKVVALKLAGTPPQVFFLGGDLIVQSGAATGKKLPLAHLDGDVIVLGVADPDVVAKLAPGDQVQVDNSNFLALETYHWHQVPGPDFAVWDQFRGSDGKPRYPQRPMLLGPVFVRAGLGVQESGHFDGKMILLSSLWDSEAFPWQADWYRQRINQVMGDKADERVRLWYTDHALHGDEPQADYFDRIVTYQGALQQALRDISDWVEHGVAPPQSTQYRIADGQVVLPVSAGGRMGIQPVVKLLVNGGTRADILAGQSVTLTGTITVPPGAGKVVSAQWDFDNSGAFATSAGLRRPAGTTTVTITHRFDAPGTYYVALRGASQRNGDRATPYARVQNMDRVRVVVK